MKLPAWTREPIVHFLGLGALVYVALTWGGQPVDPSSRVIEVGSEEQVELSLSFERVMGRAPTDAELDARIDEFVRDEVLYREALRLGLDQGDAVVRQRMVAKMDMSATGAVEAAQPDDAALRAFYAENADRYSDEVLVTFDQAYFSNEGAAQAALDGAGGADLSGEQISLPGSVEGTNLREVQTRFGEVFARALAGLEPQAAWQGPVPSGFGWHIVRLRERSTEASDFEAVRGRVENDWRSAEIADRKVRSFEVLRSAYRIEIDR